MTATSPDSQPEVTPTAPLRARLDDLRSERAKGEQMLAHAESEVLELRSQLLRLSGAIQVMEELLGENPAS